MRKKSTSNIRHRFCIFAMSYIHIILFHIYIAKESFIHYKFHQEKGSSCETRFRPIFKFPHSNLSCLKHLNKHVNCELCGST